MAEIGAALPWLARRLGPLLLFQESSGSGRLGARRRASEGRLVKCVDQVSFAGDFSLPLRPSFGLLQNKRIVQKCQSLGWNVRCAAAAGRRGCRRIVEGQKHRIQKVAAYGQKNTAPAIAVERTRNERPSAARHKFIEMHGDAWSFQPFVQPAGNGEN